jgi:TerC family integral membrane protein
MLIRFALLTATLASAACFAPAVWRGTTTANLRSYRTSIQGLGYASLRRCFVHARACVHVPTLTRDAFRCLFCSTPTLRLGSVGARRQAQARGLKTQPMMQVQPGSEATEDEDFNRAIKNTAIAVSAALAFGAGLFVTKGQQSGFEFLTGYVVEQSLSVDNLFVFILLFQYFKVPEPLQRTVLSWGIAGAVVMRGAFITAGLVAIKTLRPVLVLFASFLIFSSYKILSGVDDDDEDEEDLSNNAVVKFSSNLIKSTENYDGDKFFTMVDGARRATPLLLVLVCVELSDVLFAVDSIPAVFGVTEDPLVVFSSNIFAILGLRALYNVLVKLVQDLEYLEPAVGLVLLFVGVKMIVEFLGVEVPEDVALAVVAMLLGGGVAASKLLPKTQDESD